MPKWTNKGHEFDELGAIFQKNKNIIVLGRKQKTINDIVNKLQFVNISNNVCSKKVNKFFLSLFSKLILGKNCTIVVANDSPNILKLLQNNKNFKQNENLFSEADFFAKYLSIYAVYVADKVYFSSNCFICTTVCTLNCKDCLNFAPYDKNKQHFDINRLKKDVDTYFRCVDRVGLFHISGGEPFSYPHLIELIEYIYENYKEKIDILGTVTNCTIIPSDELCETFRRCHVRVELDDYTCTLKYLDKKIQLIKKKLKEHGVLIQINEASVFYSLFPSQSNWKNETDDTLIKKFSACDQIYSELKNGKIYTCNWAEFAEQAGVFPCQNDYFDINKENLNKKELVEYRLRFNDKGYVEFCKYCNGTPNINKRPRVAAALQAKGHFSWDINNPTMISNESDN